MNSCAVLALLCLLVGLGATQRGSIPWGDQTLRYRYQAKVVTGIHQISDDAAGTGLEALVVIRTQDDRLTIQLEDVRVGHVNGRLPLEGRQHHEKLAFHEADQDTKAKLNLPISAHYVYGRIQDVKVHEQDDIWSINIKKAILTLLNVDLKPVGRREHLPVTYTTAEHGIGGFCPSFYVVESVPSPFHPHSHLLEVTKNKNFKNCISRPKYVRTSFPVIEAGYDDVDQVQILKSEEQIKYTIVGGSDKFVIEKVKSEGLTRFMPFTAKADHLTTTHKIELTLIEGEQYIEQFSQYGNSFSSRNERQQKWWQPDTLFTSPSRRHRRSLISLRPRRLELESPEQEQTFESQEQHKYGAEYRNQHGYEYPKYGDEKYDNEFGRKFEGEYENEKYGRGYEHSKMEREHEGRYNQYLDSDKYGREYESNKLNRDYNNRNFENKMEEREEQFFNNRYGRVEEEKKYGEEERELLNKKINSLHFTMPEQYYGNQQYEKTNAFFHKYESEHRMDIAEIKMLLNRLVQTLNHENHEESFNQSPVEYLHLIENLRHFNYRELMQLIEELSQEQTRHHEIKHLFVDALVATGTNPAILAIHTAVERELIRGEYATQAIQGIPTYVIKPSVYLIEKILSLVKVPHVTKNHQLYKTVVLTVGELIGQTCYPGIRYTVHKHTDCRQTIAHKLINDLKEILEKETYVGVRGATIQALGLTAHPSILRVLVPYIHGKATLNPYLRTKAIHALSKITEFTPKQIIEVLQPVLFDTTEVTEVRTAAFDILLVTSEPKNFLERAAKLTWKEPNHQVGSYISSTLYSLANVTTPDYKYMYQYAKVAADITKEYNGMHKSVNKFFSNFNEHFGLGSGLKVSYVHGRHSVIPKSIHLRLANILGNRWAKMFQASIHTQGLQTVLDRLVGPQGAFIQYPTLKSLFSAFEEESQFTQRQTDEHLNLKFRRNEPVQLGVYLNFLGSQHRQFFLDEHTIERIISQYGHYANPSTILSMLSSGIETQYTKAINLIDTTIVVPNPAGFPLSLHINAPAVFHMKAKLQGKLPHSMHAPLYDSHLTVEATPRFAARLVARLGVSAPFLRVFAGAGVEVQTLAAMPFHAQVKFDQDRKFVFAMRPSTSIAPQMLPRVHYKVQPFTVIYSKEQKRPLIHSIKPIKTTEPKKFEHDMSHMVFGAPLVIYGEHELDYYTPASFYTRLARHGLLNTLNFWWTTPETKYRELNVEYRRSAQHERQLEYVFTLNYIPSQIGKKYVEKFSLFDTWIQVADWLNVPTDCQSEQQMYYEPTYGVRSSSQLPWWKSYVSELRNIDYSNLYRQVEEERLQEGERQLPGLYRTTAGRQALDQEINEEYYPESRRVHAYQAQVEKMPVNISGPKIELNFLVQTRGSSHTTAHLQIYITKHTPHQYKTEFEFKLSPEVTHAQTQYKVCGKGEVKYPKLPCSYEHKFNPRNYGKIHSEFKLNWGEETCREENVMEIKMEAKKSEKQLIHEEEPTKYYFRECREDQSRGYTVSKACDKVIRDISTLNMVYVKAQWNKHLPHVSKIFLHHLDTLIKSVYYKHITTELKENMREGQFELIAEVEKYKPILSLEYIKPYETVRINKIYTPLIGKYVMPMLSYPGAIKRDIQRIVGEPVFPVCKMSGNFMKTFDGNTLTVPFSPCYHVIAKDCSSSDLFSVLARKVHSTESHKKTIEVRLLKHFIEIVPPKHQEQAEVIVDGQKHMLLPGQSMIVKTQKYGPIATVAYSGVTVYVVAPYHGLEVVTDGYNVKVEVSNMWRGKVCGVCGEMIPSSKIQLMGPNKCFYQTGRQLLDAYLVPQGSQNCRRFQEEQLQKERICLDKPQGHKYQKLYESDLYKVNGRYEREYGQYERREEGEEYRHQRHHNEEQYDDILRQTGEGFYNYKRQEGEGQTDYTQGLTKKTLVKTIQSIGSEEKVCFTLYPVKECRHGYRKLSQDIVTVPFHCYHRSNPKVQHLIHKQKTEKVLPEMMEETADFSEQVSEALQCEADYEQTYTQEYRRHDREYQQGEEHVGIRKQTLIENTQIDGQDKVCFSLHPVPKCVSGYKRVAQDLKEVHFKCFDAAQPRAHLLAHQVRSQGILEEIRGETPDMTKFITVAVRCQPELQY